MDSMCELAARINEYYAVLYLMMNLLLVIIGCAIGTWAGLSVVHDERWCLFCHHDGVRPKVAVA
jgi:hypothetical protein